METLHHPNHSEEDYTKIGNYTRTWKVLNMGVFKVFECSFYVKNPSQLIRDFEDSGKTYGQKKRLDQIAHFITDPANGYDIKFEFSPLQNYKAYGREKKGLQGTLKRIGYEVDDKWNVLTDKSHEKDVHRYVDFMIGRVKNQSEIYKNRKKGDRYVFHLQGYETVKISYYPAEKNTKAQHSSVSFDDYKVLRGVMLNFLTNTYCHDEVKGLMPNALMDGLLQ